MQEAKQLPVRHLKILVLVLFAVFSLACFNHAELENTKVAEQPKKKEVLPQPPENLSDFERELQSMRVADFDYIFVLKRKDGNKFTSEDKAFVRENKHYAANRFSLIEDDKSLFVGSNYEFTEENLMALKERFEFQDFSKPKEQIEKEKLEAEAEANEDTKEKEEKSKK